MALRPRTVGISLEVRWIPATPEALVETRCPGCGGYVDLDSPVPGRSDRLLGICGKCDRWCLVDVVRGWEEAMVVLMPEPAEVLVALTGGPMAGAKS